MAGYQSLTLASVLSILTVVLAVMGGWPWIKRWRPLTLAPADDFPDEHGSVLQSGRSDAPTTGTTASNNGHVPRVVARVLEEGPKVLYGGDIAYKECRVPYKDDGNPTVVEVEDPGDAYLITLAYLARKGTTHEGEKESEFTKIVGTTYLKILDAGGKVIRSKVVNMTWVDMPLDSRWYYSVSCDTVVSGLPKGRYGLEVYDSSTGRGGREYRNMLMNVISLGSAAALPAPEEWHGWRD